MKTIILFLTLVAIVWFNWDKVPEPIRAVSEKVWEKGTEIAKKGENPPVPVKKYLQAKLDSLKK